METASTNHLTPASSTDPSSVNTVGEAGEQLAALLIRKGHLNQEQLTHALRVRSKLPSPPTLLSVLLELQYVTIEVVREAIRSSPLDVPLGCLLLEFGYIKEPELRAALALQAEKPGKMLGQILAESDYIAEDDLIEALSYHFGLESLMPTSFQPNADLFRLAPIAWLRANECVPLARRDGSIVVAFADPLNQQTLETARRFFGMNMVVGIARRDEIQLALNRLEMAAARKAMPQSGDSLVVQLVNEIVSDAADSNASDIHIEPMKDTLRIRFRRDGVLALYRELPLDIVPSLTSRIKIMANADIAEKRRHQDGRMLFEHKGDPLDIRLSTYSTIYGETIVMRLLSNKNQLLEIREIGMVAGTLQRFTEDVLDAPSGVVIITGPTGSGKTTTLYASINYLNHPHTSIITAEDPVEYLLEGVSQCSINPKINITFEDTLKHMMRQDPDVIVIGEIRDQFSAETAIHAALTGHKVLTTFHTEDSIGGLLRLMNMDIEAFLISSTVVSVVAQRLLRRVCPHCAEDKPLTPQETRRLGYEPLEAAGMAFKVGRGCIRCRYRGYLGRIAIFELLVLNELVKDAVIARKTSSEIRRIGIDSSGLVTLLEDAIYKGTQGLTTLEEIMRQVPRLTKPRPLGELNRLLGRM